MFCLYCTRECKCSRGGWSGMLLSSGCLQSNHFPMPEHLGTLFPPKKKKIPCLQYLIHLLYSTHLFHPILSTYNSFSVLSTSVTSASDSNNNEINSCEEEFIIPMRSIHSIGSSYC